MMALSNKYAHCSPMTNFKFIWTQVTHLTTGMRDEYLLIFLYINTIEMHVKSYRDLFDCFSTCLPISAISLVIK